MSAMHAPACPCCVAGVIPSLSGLAAEAAARALDEAGALAEEGAFVEALALFRRAAAAAPSAKAWEAVAQLELEVDADALSPARAVAAAREARALAPEWPEARVTLGRSLLAASMWGDAVRELEQTDEAEDLREARCLAAAELDADQSGRNRFIKIAGRDLRVPRVSTGAAAGSGPASRVWECGVVLAAALDWAGLRLQGVRAVELGAGCGVAGLAAAFLGADVLLTDRDAAVVEAAVADHEDLEGMHRENGHEGGRGGSCRSAQLDWGSVDDRAAVLRSEDRGFDLVLAADSIYHEDTLAPWLATLDAFLATGATLICAHKRRHAHVDAALESALAARGEPRRLEHHPLHVSDRVDVWVLRRLDCGEPPPQLAPVLDVTVA
ncbi:putative methyltransferase-domain-containing protein [Pelagophyceae sp. CCMP2097]|nr:putative methyltransferase-domain-containing protein [Pelagophyceae sp. CCMP2097]